MNTADGFGITAFQPKVCKLYPRSEHAANITEALHFYEVQVKVYAYQLEQVIAQNAGQPINVNQYFYWFSFDVMGQFAFSKSFNMLRSRTWHHAVQMLRAGLALVGPFTPAPWLVRIAFDIPLLPIVRDFQAMEAWCVKRMDERIEVGHSHADDCPIRLIAEVVVVYF